MTKVFNYLDRDSIIHKMTGASKLACLLLWTLSAMLTFNTIFLIILTLFGFLLFPLSKIKFKDVRASFIFLMVFMVFNAVLIYLFAPEQGVEIFGTKHLLFTIYGKYTITLEQLLYQLNVCLKYLATIPIILVFCASTNPSELAASLNRIGISYKVSYAVSLTLRYIPDLVVEYQDVSRSLQARGVEMSKKGSLIKRIGAAISIVIPLILSSIGRIETITNAMELRKFGTAKTRTWVMARKFGKSDYTALAIGAGLMIYAIAFIVLNGSRYWNPFI